MFQENKLEELVKDNLKGLPNDFLEEVLDFILFLKERKLSKNHLIYNDLKSLKKSESEHLEEEFKDFDKLFPKND